MPAGKGDAMRGLAVFISDIRNCKSKEAEVRRINKELANVRSKFKGDKTMDGYQKKKYVCKLLFIFLLGHDIDFGHTEAVNLLCSNRFTEKQIGYLFISVLVNENSNLMNLVVQRLKDDLNSRNPVFVNLALQCIANIGSKEMVEIFSPIIPKLLVSGETIDTVKQSAALCMVKLIRRAPEVVVYDDWTSRVIHLINDQHMGVVTAAVSLVEILVKRSPEDYKGCVSLAVSRLSRIVTASYTDLQDYTYYFVPAPWLSVKLLRLLQNYPPPEEPSVRSRLTECLESILNKAGDAPKSKKVQHTNAKNAVLFEAINLIIHLDSDPGLLVRACNQLGQFLKHRETNMRYLALESMCLLSTSEFSHDAVKKHLDTVVEALKSERDVSVRQRAVDLLYAMCDCTNAENIVSEMLLYLERADYSIREEMVLKVAILAEKYAVDYTWYVDTILNLIRIAGDYVSDEVWFRVIQVVINREDVQGYAAKTVFEALQAPACHENMVKVGGYILGEFGNLIAGDQRSAPLVQFELLHNKFHLCSVVTRQLLLSTYIKFINLFPEIKSQIMSVLLSDANSRNSDVEIQQRSVEYYHLARIASEEVLATVLEEMPPFTERESSILSKLKQKRPGGALTSNSGDSNARNRSRVAAGAVMPSTEGAISSPSSQLASRAALNSSTNQRPASIIDGVADLLSLDDDGGKPTASSNLPAGSHHLGLGDNSNGLDDFLNDLLGNPAPSSQQPSNDSAASLWDSGSTDDFFDKLVLKANGVLFENDCLQIGVKSEYRDNLGRLGIFYGNKSGLALTQFTTEVRLPAETNQVAGEPTSPPALNIEAKPAADCIEPGTQIQQLVTVECVRDFTFVPRLVVSFQYAGARQTLNLQLPITVIKFIAPTEMNQQLFFQRWKNLSSPSQECQKIFKAKFEMDKTAIDLKLAGSGACMLANVDPSPINCVGAGIMHTTDQQIGILFRLEPNLQTQMYRLTVRSFKERVAKRVCQLLESQL